MALKAVFFDVGETLVDEERWWRVLAERSGCSRTSSGRLSVSRSSGARSTTSSGAISASSGRRPGHDLSYELDDLYPDALACLEAVRGLGLRVGIVGNQPELMERWARDEALPADVISSSASLASRSRTGASSSVVVELAECDAAEVAYVGDRVDNDVLPAAAAGLVAVHVRRGPWGMLQRRRPRRRSASTTSPRSRTR